MKTTEVKEVTHDSPRVELEATSDSPMMVDNLGYSVIYDSPPIDLDTTSHAPMSLETDGYSEIDAAPLDSPCLVFADTASNSPCRKRFKKSPPSHIRELRERFDSIFNDMSMKSINDVTLKQVVTPEYRKACAGLVPDRWTIYLL